MILLFNFGALVIAVIIQYPNIYCLFICRAFQGYFVGNFMALVPVYINELSPK
jgi:MFS family permease